MSKESTLDYFFGKKHKFSPSDDNLEASDIASQRKRLRNQPSGEKLVELIHIKLETPKMKDLNKNKDLEETKFNNNFISPTSFQKYTQNSSNEEHVLSHEMIYIYFKDE